MYTLHMFFLSLFLFPHLLSVVFVTIIVEGIMVFRIFLKKKQTF